MPANSWNERGLRLLSIDGGGIQGLSALLILKEILFRYSQQLGRTDIIRPCEVFDLAGGTSTGGLIVIMLLFRLRMSIEDAIKAFVDLAKSVFSEKTWHHQQKQKTTRLEEALLHIVASALGVKTEVARGILLLNEEGTKCFVCATPDQHIGLPNIFRSWRPRGNPTFNCTIIEAARATSVHPTLFEPIEIGEENLKERFVDGGFRCNNPIRYVLQEAHSSFPARPVSCVVSLGVGIPTVFNLKRSTQFDMFRNDCENTSEEVAKQSPSMSDIYFRLNVEQGLQNTSLLEDIKVHTQQYLKMCEVNLKVDRLIVALRDYPGVPLGNHFVSPTTELTAFEHHAFDKLERVISINAYHDSQARSGLSGCLSGTRKEEIGMIVDWIEMSGNQKPLFIVLGSAGSGKSSLLWTVAQICKEKQSYGAGFFFSSTEPERNNGARLINTIAYQLTEAIPALRPYVARAVKAAPSILSRSLKVQVDELLIQPFKQLQTANSAYASCFRHCVVVIDALDECHDYQDQRVLPALTAALSDSSFPFLCILSSRFDFHIGQALEPAIPLIYAQLTLGQDRVKEGQDILTYLQESTKNVRNKHQCRAEIPEGWPAAADLELIVERSGGQFVYAATAIRYIESAQDLPHHRLQHFLGISFPASGVNPFAPLDDMYRALMAFSMSMHGTAIMEILGIELVRSSDRFWIPVTLEFYLNNLFENHIKTLRANIVLAPFSSILGYNVQDHEVTFYHLSFVEFLLDAARSREFFIDPVRWQGWIMSHLVQFFYEDKGISLVDVRHMIQEAKPRTALHRAIRMGFNLVNDHPRSLAGRGDFNIWPFVTWGFFRELQFYISIEEIATVFLQRREHCLPLPVLIKLTVTHKLGNSFILFELCRTIADLEMTGSIKVISTLDWDSSFEDFLLWITYLAEYLDHQRLSGCNILLPEDYLSATLRCLWYLQTPFLNVCSSLQDQICSLKYLQTRFGLGKFLRPTSKRMTRGPLKTLVSLLRECPPSLELLSSLKSPLHDEVTSKNPFASQKARECIHKYLMEHDFDYKGDDAKISTSSMGLRKMKLIFVFLYFIYLVYIYNK